MDPVLSAVVTDLGAVAQEQGVRLLLVGAWARDLCLGSAVASRATDDADFAVLIDSWERFDRFLGACGPHFRDIDLREATAKCRSRIERAAHGVRGRTVRRQVRSVEPLIDCLAAPGSSVSLRDPRWTRKPRYPRYNGHPSHASGAGSRSRYARSSHPDHRNSAF
jgi:hypothetical protein